ncbi:hypothetical protein BJV78DRAFT_1141541 [Lactifluus subvellereus]|nr:hypothetical protein BJV78DRAFT_1141541 [Lactifluus subvellereus]
MTSAGEKQYYAVALLRRLFEHIPSHMTVGVLYDIGCQLHRSCKKWGFLEEFLPRITFGISVFHAYGHQWPCQIIYHPRKCRGFGLTDGEGCERFWSSLKKLIPGLRVTGYYQRILIIDNQICFLNEKALDGIGHWLYWRWYHCQQKKQEADGVLAACGVGEDVLRSEWAAQVREQTKPLPRKSTLLLYRYCSNQLVNIFRSIA